MIKEFKPSDHLPDAVVKQLKGGLVILGHVTAEDKCYAVFCERGKASSTLKVLKTVAVDLPRQSMASIRVFPIDK